MTEIDTSAEAVAVMATQHDNTARHDPRCPLELKDWHRETAATLRALVAERDALVKQNLADLENAGNVVAKEVQKTIDAEASRDRLAARVAELEGALRQAMYDAPGWYGKARAALYGSAPDDC